MYSQRNCRGADNLTLPELASDWRPSESKTRCSKRPSRPVRPLVKALIFSRAPARAAGLSRLAAMARDNRNRGDIRAIRKENFGNSPATGMNETLSARGRRRQHAAVAIMLLRRNHACGFHRLHQPRGTVVADLQSPLHAGNGGAPGFGD